VRVSLSINLAIPQPWDEHTERQAFHDLLEEVELADQLGFSAVWPVEHHFMEEYCHMSAPEVVLAAISQRTTRIRLGHGVTLMPPIINHPARVAERVATLDLLSNGRVELGTGESSSAAELDGFQVDPGKKQAMWDEGLQVAIQCMADTPFRGFEGEYVSMPPRNVIPKPIQRPHPPLWVACTRPEKLDMAGWRGLGALSFSFKTP
jgi:alkanesulfonate monooxygenase SsuD/methylene tetrahydromethanopterin reductase-like flavin-dependent oxidoreductase (luciferase family)